MTAPDGITGASPTNFLLVGVGGQGILLAADILALVGIQIGLDVKKSEVHGMAQRGGSVTSHVRWGQAVHSPLITPGEVDYLMALERLEALRYADQMRPTGTMLINDYRVAPISVGSGNDAYPMQSDEEKVYGATSLRCHYVPAMKLAQELGQARVNNVVMLGALSVLLGVEERIWLNVVAGRVPPRFVQLNHAAFASGRAFMSAATRGATL